MMLLRGFDGKYVILIEHLTIVFEVQDCSMWARNVCIYIMIIFILNLFSCSRRDLVLQKFMLL